MATFKLALFCGMKITPIKNAELLVLECVVFRKMRALQLVFQQFELTIERLDQQPVLSGV